MWAHKKGVGSKCENQRVEGGVGFLLAGVQKERSGVAARDLEKRRKGEDLSWGTLRKEWG